MSLSFIGAEIVQCNQDIAEIQADLESLPPVGPQEEETFKKERDLQDARLKHMEDKLQWLRAEYYTLNTEERGGSMALMSTGAVCALLALTAFVLFVPPIAYLASNGVGVQQARATLFQVEGSAWETGIRIATFIISKVAEAADIMFKALLWIPRLLPALAAWRATGQLAADQVPLHQGDAPPRRTHRQAITLFFAKLFKASGCLLWHCWLPLLLAASSAYATVKCLPAWPLTLRVPLAVQNALQAPDQADKLAKWAQLVRCFRTTATELHGWALGGYERVS